MKRNVGLVVDSTFGLSEAFVKEHGITVVPLKVIIGADEFIDGQMDPDFVVKALHEGIQVKTSQPSPESFIQAYEEQLKHYPDVLCLTLSKSLSGTYNSATLAQTISENPHVVVVDSETTIHGGIYLVEELIKFFGEGHSVQEGLVYLEELKERGSLIFTVDNLQTLVRNGRLSKVQGFIGNVLKIKPILRFRRGVLEVEHKVRSFKNVILYLLEEVKKMLPLGKVAVYIAYVDGSVEAKELEHEIFQLSDQLRVRITGVISPVVSAHVGLGGLGIYLTNE